MALGEKIEDGDIVKLSLHPTKFMTAHSIDGNAVECVWTNSIGSVIYRIFDMSALELVSKKGAASTSK